MKVEVKDCKNVWSDLVAGDTCEFQSACGNFVGMRVETALGDEFLLDLEDFMLYEDCENYKIIKVFETASMTLE